MISRFLLAACCAGIAMGAQPPQKVFPYAYSQEDLPNGLRLVTVPTDYPNIVGSSSLSRPARAMKWNPGTPASLTCLST